MRLFQNKLNHASPVALSFGQPEPVSELILSDKWKCFFNGQYYETPFDFAALARTVYADAVHGSALQLKLQTLVADFIPHPWLSRAEFKKWVQDRLVLGNHYLSEVRNAFGDIIRLESLPAVYMRRGRDEGDYFYLQHEQWLQTVGHGIKPINRQVHHLLDPDLLQEIYGLPTYLGALNSILLNESAGLFRRRYYVNGNHAGYIMHITDSTIDDNFMKQLTNQVSQSKGPGNFKSLLLYSPGGEKDGVKIIPVGETKTNDDFGTVKNISREDIAAAHRVPLQLLSIAPKGNGASLGDAKVAGDNFRAFEIEPLRQEMLEINRLIDEEVIRFKQSKLSESPE